MVSEIFQTIGEALSEFMNVITTGFNSVVGLVWTAGEGGAGSLTPLGVILLIGLGVGVAYFAISFLIRAIRNVGKAN